MNKVKFQVDYGMLSDDIAPLFIDGGATGYSDWNFSENLNAKLRRVCAIFDHQINWKEPKDETWIFPAEEREEFYRLIPEITDQLQHELGAEWQVEVFPMRVRNS